jgi:hypothetical protein
MTHHPVMLMTCFLPYTSWWLRSLLVTLARRDINGSSRSYMKFFTFHSAVCAELEIGGHKLVSDNLNQLVSLVLKKTLIAMPQ